MTIGDRVTDPRFGRTGTIIHEEEHVKLPPLQSYRTFTIMNDEGEIWNGHEWGLKQEPETFAEFITRPSGFGRTSWWAFAWMQGIFIAGMIASLGSFSDGGWAGAAVLMLMQGALWLGTYLNWTGRWQ
jgi:hypothetical protein